VFSLCRISLDTFFSPAPLRFWLVKSGFMKVFEGAWEIIEASSEGPDPAAAAAATLTPRERAADIDIPLREEALALSEELWRVLRGSGDGVSGGKGKGSGSGSGWVPRRRDLPEGSTSSACLAPSSETSSGASGSLSLPSASATTSSSASSSHLSAKPSSSSGPSTGAAGAPSRPPQPYSLVTLRQRVHPFVTPPSMLAHYLRKITAKVIREMMCDLLEEAGRINALRVHQERVDHVASHALSLDDLGLSDEEDELSPAELEAQKQMKGSSRSGPETGKGAAAAAAAAAEKGDEGANGDKGMAMRDLSWGADGEEAEEGAMAAAVVSVWGRLCGERERS
jgi:hypothetical protein